MFELSNKRRVCRTFGIFKYERETDSRTHTSTNAQYICRHSLKFTLFRSTKNSNSCYNVALLITIVFNLSLVTSLALILSLFLYLFLSDYTWYLFLFREALIFRSRSFTMFPGIEEIHPREITLHKTSSFLSSLLYVANVSIMSSF